METRNQRLVVCQGTSPVMFSRVKGHLWEFFPWQNDANAKIYRGKFKKATIFQQTQENLYYEQQQPEELLYFENPDKGALGIPPQVLFACLEEAGRRVIYKGRKHISTQERSLLPQFFQVENDFISIKITTPKEKLIELKKKKNSHIIEISEEGWAVDQRKVRLKQKRSKDIIFCIQRPIIFDWQFACTISFDSQNHPVNDETIKKLFKVAGHMVGLGSFRPACRGQYGCFKVIDWKHLPERIQSETKIASSS